MNIGNDNNKTMETNEKITDELIAKYISRKTNEEEDRFIHDYLARNPEFANDLLDIATAIRHQRKHDETTANKGKEQPQEATRVRLTLRRTFYALAASFVLLIGIRFFVSKPFANNEIIPEQPTIAEANTETSNTPTDSDESSEETVLETPAIAGAEPEEVLFADNQTTDVQHTENITEPQVNQSLLADNTNPPQQQEADVASANPDVPVMAAQTVYQDNSDEPCMEEAVFDIDNIPTTWNPNKDLVLKWECNAPEVAIEFSIDGGKTWKLRYTNPRNNQLTISTLKLKDFKLDNPEGFNWKITVQYRDGSLTKEGFVRFTNDNN